jgi:hypothetical protein
MFGLSPLVPAYGRDYTSKAKAQADFDAGKDFATASGQYTNKADLIAMGKSGKIECRNANLRKLWMLTIS